MDRVLPLLIHEGSAAELELRGEVGVNGLNINPLHVFPVNRSQVSD